MLLEPLLPEPVLPEQPKLDVPIAIYRKFIPSKYAIS
jgi:hypothetical protein